METKMKYVDGKMIWYAERQSRHRRFSKESGRPLSRRKLINVNSVEQCLATILSGHKRSLTHVIPRRKKKESKLDFQRFRNKKKMLLHICVRFDTFAVTFLDW